MRETLPTLIEDIHQGALRIQKIITDLKDFVRPSAIINGTEFNLNETIQRVLKLLSHAIKKRTDHLQVDLAEDLPPLLGNAQQLEQVVVNLIMNALEALPDKTHGLSLATHLKHEDNCIELQVADEGIGIAPENLNRICEPFFTTKQHQQGTGLGLFIAYKLVTAHHGILSFQSEPGRGTVALVRLPLSGKLPTR
jgi:signal transduction histidine kinase